MEQLTILLASYFFIFAARIIDVSLDVVRILMLMRNKKMLAAIAGLFEVIVWVIALNEVLQGGFDNIFKILAYAGGFATGNYIGCILEEYMAMGYLSMQVFPPPQLEQRFITNLRREGFGVTTVAGEGRDGPRNILFVTLKRKNLNKAMNVLDDIMPGVFFSVSDARTIKGGVFPVSRPRK